MKYIVFLVSIIIFLATIIFWQAHRKQSGQEHMETGTVILLNGPSASGKSTLQKQLQELLEEPYLAMGINTFFVRIIPERYYRGSSPEEPARKEVMEGILSKDTEGNPIFDLKIGPAGQRIIAGMHQAFGAYAKAGNNIIVDYILYEQRWIPDLIKALKGLHVYMIGIDIPLAVLEEREKLRGTSPVGHARSHFDKIHQGMFYDFKLDISAMTAKEAATKIKEFMEQNPRPEAFEKMARQYGY